jgi:hypothetical protein
MRLQELRGIRSHSLGMQLIRKREPSYSRRILLLVLYQILFHKLDIGI